MVTGSAVLFCFSFSSSGLNKSIEVWVWIISRTWNAICRSGWVIFKVASDNVHIHVRTLYTLWKIKKNTLIKKKCYKYPPCLSPYMFALQCWFDRSFAKMLERVKFQDKHTVPYYCVSHVLCYIICWKCQKFSEETETPNTLLQCYQRKYLFMLKIVNFWPNLTILKSQKW